MALASSTRFASAAGSTAQLTSGPPMTSTDQFQPVDATPTSAASIPVSRLKNRPSDCS